jgi:two-component system, LytTR family, response regulator
VDDEKLARRRIRRLLAAESDVEVIGECEDPKDAIAAIRQRAPDLLFLDVQMSEMDGFGVLESVGGSHTPAVIFVTAFDQYALRAFDVHALDYLLKPFDRARFRRALDRARAQLRQQAGTTLDHRLSALIESLGSRPKNLDRVVIKSAGRIMFLRTDEIDWIEAADNYVRLHVGQESHLLRETLGSLEARLDAAKFLRIHRSTLINVDRMKELQPWFHGDYVVILQDGTKLNLSRTYRDRVIQMLGEFF